MKLASWNVNGIRACHQKGFLTWLKAENPDVVCLQEVKARPEQLEDSIANPKGHYSFWHPAEKPGYSGLAVYSKKEPLGIKYGVGDSEIDREGRVLTLEYSNLTLINCYFPNSQRDHARLPFKIKFCNLILRHCQKLRKSGQNILICGDFNIAHKEIDLKNPKTNKDNAGFLPEERAWMDTFVEKGFVDTFRIFNGSGGHYTWWSYRPGVREKNIGWRLDYFFTNSEMASRIKSVEHRPQVFGSDHCPVVLELKR